MSKSKNKQPKLFCSRGILSREEAGSYCEITTTEPDGMCCCMCLTAKEKKKKGD